MELLYVWIEDYKNIHHQGFNFSPKYRFEFDYEKKELTFEDNSKDCLEDFLGKDIANITAIIGANGAGKSNLLEFIIKKHWTIFIKDNVIGTEKEYGYFAVLRSKDEYIIKDPNSLVKEKPKLLNLTNPINPIQHSSIFFSNIISGKNNVTDRAQFIETNNPITNNIFNVSSEELCYGDDRITTFSFNENIRQIYFTYTDTYQGLKKSGVPFKEIPKINILINRPNISDSIKKAERTFNTLRSYYEMEDNTLPSNKFKKEVNWEYIFYTHIIIMLFSQYFDEYEKKSLYNNPFENNSNILKESSYRRDLFSEDGEKLLVEITKSIKAFILELDEDTNFPNFNLHQNFDNCFNALSNLLKSANVNFSQNENNSIPVYLFESINLTEKIEKEFKNFISVYKESVKFLTGHYFLFEWSDMSTGEKAMLSLYSRFNSIVNKELNLGKKLDLEKTESILILIDEGESGFHPEWQRNYLKYLIDFFPQIYPGKQIQIILTTHSPFLASDLPKENIIFLEKGKEGQKFPDGTDANGKCIVVDGLKDKKQTFGANIHTLLSDSFFLEKGLIGEFAKGKIQEVIDYLNDSANRSIEKDEKMQAIIDMIGEPILKRQLQLMMDSKRLQKVELRIKKLEEEIENLKKGATNDSN